MNKSENNENKVKNNQEETEATQEDRKPWRDRVIEQIMIIRDEGHFNMFDANGVQRRAYEKDLFELVTFIDANKSNYGKFIMTGDPELITE